MRKSVLLLFAIVLVALSGCASNVSMLKQSTETPPAGSDLAVIFFDYTDNAVSEKATEAALTIIRNNRGEVAFPPAKTDEILQKNKVVIPRRVYPEFVVSVGKLVPAKYLMMGQVTSWYKGHASFPVAKNTLFGATITVYRMSDGQPVWSAGVQDVGGAGIFAEEPEVLALSSYKKIFKTWSGFITK